MAGLSQDQLTIAFLDLKFSLLYFNSYLKVVWE